jgi:hypothetical protein
VIVLPTQTGLLDEITGAAGVGFTITVVELAILAHPLTVTVKE